MKYTLIKELPPYGKMEVTEEQSKALQEELFRQGKEWSGEDEPQIINHLDKPFIYWDGDSEFICHSPETDRAYFNVDENPLIKFENHFKTPTQ